MTDPTERNDMSTAPKPGNEGLTPGDRRELRALVKRRFAMLRKEVQRREQEMRAEIEARLTEKYREDERQMAAMQSEVAKARDDYIRAVHEIQTRYQDAMPGWSIGVANNDRLIGSSNTRTQERMALLQAIPVQVQEAEQQLDQQEMDLLQKLTLGGLESEQATAFINSIPTVSQLIPSSRLRELEASFKADTIDG